MMLRKSLSVWLLISGTVLVGCESQNKPAGRAVTQVWEQPREPQPVPYQPAAEPPPTTDASPAGPQPILEPVAIVNGSPIDRNAFARRVLDSYGLAVFEQLVMLELARHKAATEKIQVSRKDIDEEYRRTLKDVSLPPGGTTTRPLDEKASEALLREILTRRNIPLGQYMLTVERNAYLRKLAEKDLVISDDQLRAAFDRLYGERVEVRHIQVPTLAEAANVRTLLDKGEDFAEVAKRHSRNLVSAPIGGLLRPFTKQDREFPPLFIQVAFALEKGQVSKAVHWQGDFHLLKLVNRYSKTKVDFEDVKGRLVERVRAEQVLQRMQTLNSTLLKEATVRILDPDLDRRFRQRLPELINP